MKIQPLETHTKILEVQSRLSKFNYLSKQPLPGTADAYVYQKLQAKQRMPSKDKYENFYHWYIMMRQFAPSAIEKWIQDDNTLQNDKLIVEILRLIESLQKVPVETGKSRNEYLIRLSSKNVSENAIKNVWKKLQNHFRSFKQKIIESKETDSELRLKLRLSEVEFEDFKEKVSKWEQVDGMEIKKMKKDGKF